GARQGRQFTYALLDIRAPRGRTLERDEALAELAARYFASRGPATVQDFAKWSGLTVADARAGLEDVRADLQSRVVGNRTYWCRPSHPARNESRSAHLLSIYDEYISGYRDRSAIVASEHGKKLVGMGNALTSVIVVDGQIVGTWRRVLGPKSVRVETRFFERPARASERAVGAETRRYAAFLERPLERG
ncbi:MAG TPA: crosslink repair DNA glycosylase YcaQ family protein, partial [Gemmatimonadota bacterium]|nr:crosslink repair DNA glycosylase YcaQ family protein [Gemmatimonadota bacterium]